MEEIRVFADIGNRSTSCIVEYGNGSRLSRTLSSKLLVEPNIYSKTEMLDISNCSYLNLVSGSQADSWGGRTIVLGEPLGASAIPVYRFGSSATAKIEASIMFLAACIEPRENITEFEVGELWVMHPKPTQEILSHYRRILGGVHKFERNGVFVSLSVPIENVILAPEGVAGYYDCVNQGIVDPEALNGYLDIGGMTTEFGFMSEKGVVPGTRSSIDFGVQAMAHQISKAMKSQGLTRKDPDTSAILDGLLRASSLESDDSGQRYFYGKGKNAVSFDRFVAPSRQAWVTELFGKFSELFSTLDAEDYSTTALIGGGVKYIPEKALQLFKQAGFNMAVPKEPSLSNVHGLIALANSEFCEQTGLPTHESGLPIFVLN